MAPSRAKRDNCQVAVGLSLATHVASLPIAWRLYLPLEWTADAARRAAAGIPETVGFLTKSEIPRQLERVPDNVTDLVISVGGNDGRPRAASAGQADDPCIGDKRRALA